MVFKWLLVKNLLLIEKWQLVSNFWSCRENISISPQKKSGNNKLYAQEVVYYRVKQHMLRN